MKSNRTHKNRSLSKSNPHTGVRQNIQAEFIFRVYGNLLAAIVAVVALEVLLFRSGLAQRIAKPMLNVPWLLVLSVFILLGWLARKVAYRAKTLAGQYLGLISYVLAKALILIPLLYQADTLAPGAIQNAALFTLIGAVGLTAVVFITRKDFSFMRAFLRWAGFVAFLLIVAAIAFRFRLGVWFDIGMIALAGTSILYDTSKTIRLYRKDRYVAASLELFASVAHMFWYALRLFRRFGRHNN